MRHAREASVFASVVGTSPRDDTASVACPRRFGAGEMPGKIDNMLRLAKVRAFLDFLGKSFPDKVFVSPR